MSGTPRESSVDLQGQDETEEEEDDDFVGYNYGYDPGAVPTVQTGSRDLSDQWHYGGYDFDPQAGADAARSTLQEAAGITPPSGNFVLKLLAGYLFVLVPLNWAIFWMIGKVEYAWIAAPIIAVAGALIVIRMASLDIGFSRSNTQVALLEIPAEYERGHLTEYSALYTSLSTAYRVELDGDGGLALPFPSNRSKTFRPSEQVPLVLDKTIANTISGVQIQSNTTELIHAENLFDAGGKIRLKIDDTGEMTLVNGTNLTFKNVLIAGGTKRVGRPKPKKEKPETEATVPPKRKLTAKLAMLESIPPNSQLKITFGDSQQLIDQYRGLPLMTNAKRTAEQIWLDKFAGAQSVPVERLADLPELQDKWSQYSNWFSLRNNGMDEYRMFASTDEKLGQTKIDPSSTQTDRQTLVVAHLSRPSLPKVRRDSNSARDLKVVSDLDTKKEQNTLEMFE